LHFGQGVKFESHRLSLSIPDVAFGRPDRVFFTKDINKHQSSDTDEHDAKEYE